MHRTHTPAAQRGSGGAIRCKVLVRHLFSHVLRRLPLNLPLYLSGSVWLCAGGLSRLHGKDLFVEVGRRSEQCGFASNMGVSENRGP